MALSFVINRPFLPLCDNLRPQPLTPPQLQFQFRPKLVKFPIPSSGIRCSSSSSSAFNDKTLISLKTATPHPNNPFACHFHTAQYGAMKKRMEKNINETGKIAIVIFSLKFKLAKGRNIRERMKQILKSIEIS